jgi:hypothetical protein
VNAHPRSGSLPIGPLLAAIGAVLLIVSLFLDWYEGDLEAFTVYEFLDLMLVLMALVTIASLAGGLGLVRQAPSPALSLAVAVFTVLVVLSQVLNDPPAVANSGAGKEVGIWLALGGAALMVAGSVLAFARVSLAFEKRADHGATPAAPEPEPADPGTDDPDPTRPLEEPEAPSPPKSRAKRPRR